MNDAEVLDAIAARYRQAVDEQDALFKRSKPSYVEDSEDLLIQFMDDVAKLLAQRDPT